MLKKKFRKFIEKIIEGILLLSSSITSITVILIIVFLFREGFGLFGQSPAEEGTILVVNQTNPVNTLSAEQVKGVFDQEITNWKEVGGNNDSIILFRIDDIGNYFTEEQLGDTFQYVPACINKLVDSLPGVVAFVLEKYATQEVIGKRLVLDKISGSDFFWAKNGFLQHIRLLCLEHSR